MFQSQLLFKMKGFIKQYYTYYSYKKRCDAQYFYALQEYQEWEQKIILQDGILLI